MSAQSLSDTALTQGARSHTFRPVRRWLCNHASTRTSGEVPDEVLFYLRAACLHSASFSALNFSGTSWSTAQRSNARGTYGSQ